MTQIYDIGIIGAGVAGAFAALKIAHSHKGLKTIIIEAGRPSRKRRTQMQGFIGLLPNSDGKLYLNDMLSVADVTTKIKTLNAFKWFKNSTEEVLNFSVIKDKSPSINTEKRIKKAGFKVKLNNHIQLFPQEIHNLSKFISDQIEEKENITSVFDVEVQKVIKERGHFTITTETEQYKCKRVLIAVGRSGWRWVSEVFQEFGIVEDNNYADIGIRIETTDTVMKDFNHSNCSISRDDLSIGPLSWNGTVIPEDHFDMVISAFRGNENRWHSNKVSFNLLGRRLFKDLGVEQASRIGQLTFILTNDRVAKEKISTLLSKKSKLSIMHEYDWLRDSVAEISSFIPEIASKGYFHFPTMMPMASKIKLGTNFSSEVDGLYVAGESARVPGILGAITSGIIAGDNICK